MCNKIDVNALARKLPPCQQLPFYTTENFTMNGWALIIQVEHVKCRAKVSLAADRFQEDLPMKHNTSPLIHLHL